MVLKIRSIKFLALGASVLFSTASAMAADIDVNVNFPGVYQQVPVIVRPAPVYVQPRPVIVGGPPIYVERDDRYWDCKKDKCKVKKAKHHKHKDHDKD
jgi:hypothetical protein